MKSAVFFSCEGNTNLYKVFNTEILTKLGMKLDVYSTIINRENIAEHAVAMKGAEFAFATWGMPDFSEEEIRKYMPNLKIVFYAAGTVQGFARPFLKNNIQVISAWAANGVSVAEITVAQIILANKGFYQSMLMMKTDPRVAKTISESYPGNYSIKVGLLGVGQIGTQVAELLKPYDIEVLVFDPFLSDARAIALGVRKAELEEIFSTCHTISNHLANLPATVGILNKKHFNIMLKNATFINTGRGAQVVEEDLADALRAVPTRTAVLDVTIKEPLDTDSPLLTLDNAILTPHIAGSSGNEVVRMAQYMIDEHSRYEKGEPLKYSVTLEMLKTMA